MHSKQIIGRPLLFFAFIVIALWIAMPIAANPLAQNESTTWAGSYSNPQGMKLTLVTESNGTYSGELVVDSDAGNQVFAVVLRPSKSSRLEGEFKSGAEAFPLSVEHGEEPDQVVLTSEGNVYQLEKEARQAANPLARAALSKPPPTTPAGSTRFEHPDGYYTVDVPAPWTSVLHAPDVLQFDTGRNDQIVLVLMGELEPDEIGKPLLEVVPVAMDVVDDFLSGLGLEVSSSRSKTDTTTVGPLTGAISKRSATNGIGEFTVWQGTVVRGDSAVLVVATVEKESELTLFPIMESVFTSVRMGQTPDRRAIANPARNVVFNGERLSDKKLKTLEGEATGLIPNGEYWYDSKTGMVGQIGGPTLAYLAAELNFCPPVAADASGGATDVAINGRFLHPQDLAGLEYYFGPIQPNRYWMDSASNYGLEGGPPLGNLLQQIAAIQSMAAAAYAGSPGGGYQNSGGGQGGYGGGSVYQHFPNLGAGGTGVGVADLGGGDSIVNAGGVMWWPGK